VRPGKDWADGVSDIWGTQRSKGCPGAQSGRNEPSAWRAMGEWRELCAGPAGRR